MRRTTAATPLPPAPPGPSTARLRVPGRVRAVFTASACAQFAWMASVDSSWTHALDLEIYRDAVAAMLSGDSLYGAEPPFNYPPFAAYLFVPLAIGPDGPVLAAWHVLKVFCLQWIVWCLLTRRPRTVRRRATLSVLLAWGASLVVDAVSYDLSYGQVNLLLMGLVLYDLFRDENGTGRFARWRGVGTGIAAGIKIVPALFIVHLFLTRQYRTATVATATFATTAAIGFATLPTAAWHYWTSVLWDSDRVGAFPEALTNQSLRGLLGRLLHDTGLVTAAWLLAATAVTLTGLLLARSLHRRGLTPEALTVIGVIVPLVTPLGWIHHWVWLLPATMLLFSRARAARSPLLWAAAAGFFVLANCRAPGLLALSTGHSPWGGSWMTSGFAADLGVAGQLFGANIVLSGLLLLGLAAAALRRSPEPPADRE